MKIDFDDRTWSLELETISNRQAAAIESHLGVTISRWAEGLDEGEKNPDYLRYCDAMYWLMLAQNGETTWKGGKYTVTIADVEYPIAKFTAAFQVALAAETAEEAAKAAAPDPTPPPADSEQSPEPPSPTTVPSSGHPDG